MQTSRTLATTGRICLVFAAALAAIPMPGIVCRGFATTDGLSKGDDQFISVNAFTDDPTILQVFRARPEGNNYSSVPIFDALDDTQRAEVQRTYAVWAEWMPYQVGQAKKTEDLTPRIATLESELSSLKGRFETLAGENAKLWKELESRTQCAPVPKSNGDLATQVHRLNLALDTLIGDPGALSCDAGHLERVKQAHRGGADATPPTPWPGVNPNKANPVTT